MNETKKTVFVAVPMSGKDDALIKRSIQLARRAYCRRKGISAKDVMFYDNLKNSKEFEKIAGRPFVDDECNRPGVMYLALAMSALNECDEVIFGKGWKEANGCCIEHEVCVRYGIPIVDLEE